jgi:hypothetical protein
MLLVDAACERALAADSGTFPFVTPFTHKLLPSGGPIPHNAASPCQEFPIRYAAIILLLLSSYAIARSSGHSARSSSGHSSYHARSYRARTPTSVRSHHAHTKSLATTHARRTTTAHIGVQRDRHGRINRSSSTRAAFVRQHPCPATGKTSGRCPGYVVDHVKALECGGADSPSNMQWQTVAAAKAKDRTERLCR